MSEDAQRVWTEQRLLNGLAITYPALKLEIPNSKFTPPEGLPYLCYSILAGDAHKGELVIGGFERHVGVFQIDVLAPENEGPGELMRVAEWAVKLFSTERAILDDNSRLNFRVGTHTYLGVSSGLARRACSIPYWRDDKVR